MSVLNVTKDNFEKEVVQSEIPVLVDFWAPWCGPCKMVTPILEEIAGEISHAKVVKVNVDEESELASNYRVMSIPTLAVFKDGKVVQTGVGAKPKADILKMLEV